MVTITLEGLQRRVAIGPEPELQIKPDGIYVPDRGKLVSFANGFWVSGDDFCTSGRIDGPVRVCGCDGDMRPIDRRTVDKLRMSSGTVYADGQVIWETDPTLANGHNDHWHSIRISSAATDE